MMRKRVLLASPNDWRSPFQVGSHHLARHFARAGWSVAHISDPISPLHLARGLTPDLHRRFTLYLSEGCHDCNGQLWSYVPAALVTPHNQPFLRTAFVHQNWQRLTWPNLPRLVKRQGFGSVDLLYIDSISQSFWLDVLDYRQMVYRVADFNPQFEKYTPHAANLEQKLAMRADLVVYPSENLKPYVEGLGARRSLCLPNGVDYAHFAADPLPVPAEYADLSGPIAVYLGVMPEWFHFEWIRHAARRLPDVSFVLIGPAERTRQELAGLSNVHALGFRDYAQVPAYLQHAHVGLIPFDVRRNPRGVEVLRPQKLYAYFAAGLPVVSCTWDEIRRLKTPARLCETADQFAEGIRQAIDNPGDAAAYRRYASGFDWSSRLHALLDALAHLEHYGELPPERALAG